MNRLLPALAAGLVLASCQPAVSPGVAIFESFRYEGRDAVYQAHPLPAKDAVYNPILPGWYSDPSFCTNGEGDYFLVTSTFSYFPGVPIFHSRDLVNWKQVGHVLDRPSQLTGLGRQHTSGGIYAPDIKYNPKNRTYYMITTNVGTGNFLVKTQDPSGAWSDPILLPQVQGIDPSLFFDDDGRAYIVNNDDAPGGKPEYDGHRTIRIVEYDVKNDCTIGERKVIVNKGVDPAAKPIWIEGPHLYKIDGKYFLMCAEGGTSDQHSEVIFRADTPMGEYKPWTRNPILTQRHLAADRPEPVTCTGHADLLQTPEGEWWGVFLGCRPLKGGFENLGRETFLLPVRWSEDGFPYFLEGEETVPVIVRRPGTRVEGNPTFGNFIVEDSFTGDKLDQAWMTLRGPADGLYALKGGALELTCSPMRATRFETPALVLRRLQHHAFSASTRMRFAPEGSEAAGLLLYKDERHQYFLKVCLMDGKPSICLERSGEALSSKALPKTFSTVDLAIASDDGLTFRFGYAVDGREMRTLVAGVDASYLSTAVAGGFTGTTVGPYAVK
ncbi:MAG: glycoside hydrolase family 43 protein [Bacteroidales bacterium]|nr:glycoside hydrolase family 43 protein [Bacteroidales bacterium]